MPPQRSPNTKPSPSPSPNPMAFAIFLTLTLIVILTPNLNLKDMVTFEECETLIQKDRQRCEMAHNKKIDNLMRELESLRQENVGLERMVDEMSRMIKEIMKRDEEG